MYSQWADIALILIVVIVIGFSMFLIYTMKQVCTASNEHDREVSIIKENMIGQEGLSPDAANRLVDLTKSRVYLTGDRNPMFVNSYRIDKSQLNKLYQYEFYVVARWAKRLEKLKAATDPNTLCYEIDRIIGDMEQHAGNYRLPDHVQSEILQVCQRLPEETLQHKYDNLFINPGFHCTSAGGGGYIPIGFAWRGGFAA